MTQQFLRRKIELIFLGVDVGVARQGEFDDGILLLLTEENADGGILAGRLHVTVKVIHIHLHLTEVLMGELVELEVDDHVATQETIIEDQVHEEVIFVEGKTFLPGLEKEAFAEFEQKALKVADNGCFEFSLCVAGFLL